MRLAFALIILVFSVASYAENVADLVRAWKSERKLQVMSAKRVLYEFKVVLGKNPIRSAALLSANRRRTSWCSTVLTE